MMKKELAEVKKREFFFKSYYYFIGKIKLYYINSYTVIFYQMATTKL